MSKGQGPPGPPNLSDLPPGWFGLFEPRPYKNISELLAIMGNILLAGEKSQDPNFRLRYIQLFDIMYKGLALFIDKEFYSKSQKDDTVVLEMEKSIIIKKEEQETTAIEIKDRPNTPYEEFGQEIIDNEEPPKEPA